MDEDRREIKSEAVDELNKFQQKSLFREYEFRRRPEEGDTANEKIEGGR